MQGKARAAALRQQAAIALGARAAPRGQSCHFLFGRRRGVDGKSRSRRATLWLLARPLYDGWHRQSGRGTLGVGL